MIRKKLSTQKSKGETQNALAYAIKKASLIESNRCQTGTQQEFIEFLAKKFDKSCKGKQQNTSFHEVLSFHNSDKITPEKALEIAKELYEETHGLNREHTFAVHNDTDELHIHFIWAPRDFNNKIYNQVDDYRIIETKINELELKYNLFNVENRKAIYDFITTNKNISAKEKALENRGIKTFKKSFMDDINSAFKKEVSTTGFLANLNRNGYDIIHNGNNAYSISKDGATFKASQLGISYSSLRKKLKENNDFIELLKYHSIKKKQTIIDVEISTNSKINFLNKPKYQTVLAKHFNPVFHENNKVEYFYNKNNKKKSFEYYKEPSKVSFNDLSNQSIKAGIQRLTQDMEKPGPLEVSGSDECKRKIWLEFKMMNLEAKGFTLEGYKPTPFDLKELEKRKADYAELDKKWKKTPEPTIETKPEPKKIDNVENEFVTDYVVDTPLFNEPVKPKQQPYVPIENTEPEKKRIKFKI